MAEGYERRDEEDEEEEPTQRYGSGRRSSVSPRDGDAKDIESIKLAEHEQYGHVKKYRASFACQTADAPVVRRVKIPL